MSRLSSPSTRWVYRVCNIATSISLPNQKINKYIYKLKAALTYQKETWRPNPPPLLPPTFLFPKLFFPPTRVWPSSFSVKTWNNWENKKKGPTFGISTFSHSFARWRTNTCMIRRTPRVFKEAPTSSNGSALYRVSKVSDRPPSDMIAPPWGDAHGTTMRLRTRP